MSAARSLLKSWVVNCLCKRPLKAPSTLHSLPNSAWIEPECTSKHIKTASDSSDSVINYSTLVYRLLGWRGPSAISRLVTFIVVNAIKRSANWAISHVLVKCIEVHPSLTHLNSPSSVFWIRLARLVKAPELHRLPRRVRSSVISTVFRVKNSIGITHQAAARPALTLSEKGIPYDGCGATIASTYRAMPHKVAYGDGIRVGKYDKSFKSYSDKSIFTVGHIVSYINSLFSNERSAATERSLRNYQS